MATHSLLSPSSSSKWLNCTKSIEMESAYPNETNPAAEWGTQVHLIGEKLLLGEDVNEGEELSDDSTPPFTVTDEQLDCALDYANYVRQLSRPDSIVEIERHYDLSFIAPDTGGTADATILTETTLHIIDLKTGRQPVSAENNTQLMLYALGALHYFEDEYIEDVTLHIVQARIGNTSSWTTTVENLLEFEAFVKEQAQKIISGNTEYNPSEKACKWCRHKANCEALRQYTEDIIKGDFDSIDEPRPALINNTHIKRVLDNASLIKSFIEAVEIEAKARIMRGESIDGYKLVESRTNRKWNPEKYEEVEEKLKAKLGENAYKKTLITPTQAIKKLKDEEFENYIIKPKGSPTVAPLSDKRPPIEDLVSDFD